MAETANEECGVGGSVEVKSSNGRHSQSEESLSEWRSSAQVENGTPSTSPPYWDIDEDDDYGLKPSELFGKHVWTIEKFSEINKRELRSSPFDAGGYKWYILIYPNGCDVCNHLSLFLCVANYDKLLPGWSHFAQFTIAVVNTDPKKSKFSDTLHRFWKKEHDWGWKKFMELPKLHEGGFINESGSLTIKAQVQVIRERVDRPFRCLDCDYRRELVRVYLSNVEQHCRRFVEDKRSKLGRLIEDKARWTSFGVFWLGMDQNSRRRMSREKMDVILKGVVKQFFIEKEVTSTLVMDSLYSGLKALEGQTKSKKARPRLLDTKDFPAPIVTVEKDMFVLVDDVLLLLERAALEPLPPKDEKGPQNQNRTKDGNDGEESNKKAIERDERRLTELGRRTVEIYVLAHIFSSKIEVAYQEAIALKRQEELIREEEEAWLAETEQRAKRGAAEREKKSKKKQAKQKRNKNKSKDKRKEEKVSSATHDKDLEEEEKNSVTDIAQSSAEKHDPLGDVSDLSDSVDDSVDTIHPDLEDRDSSSVHWDTDTLENSPRPSGGTGTGRSISISTPNGIAERKSQSVMDDTSSTCSNDSIRSGFTNGSCKGNVLNFQNHKSPNKGNNHQVKVTSDARGETEDQPSALGSDPKSQDYSSETSNLGESDWIVVSHFQEPASSRNRSPIGKERNKAQTIVNSVDMDRPKEKSAAVLSSPGSVAKNPSPSTQIKPEKKIADAIPNRKVISATGPPSSSQISQTVGLRGDTQKVSTPKQPATTTISRPSSAPIIHATTQSFASPIIVSSSVQSTSTTSLPRSVSSAGRLGPDPSHHNQQTFVPQSYKHAIVGNSHGSSSSSGFNHHGVVPTTLPSTSSSQTPTSSYPFSQDNGHLWAGRSGVNNPYTPVVTSNNRSLNHNDIQRQTQSLMTDEFPHLDIINDLLEDEQCNNMMFNGNIFNSQRPQPFNRQYSYHGGDIGGISGELLSNGRSRSFGEERLRYMPRVSAGGGPYVDGLDPATQWQMAANMDLSLLAMRNNDATTPYHHQTYFGLDSTNPSFASSGVNGYTEFRPSNGH